MNVDEAINARYLVPRIRWLRWLYRESERHAPVYYVTLPLWMARSCWLRPCGTSWGDGALTQRCTRPRHRGVHEDSAGCRWTQ